MNYEIIQGDCLQTLATLPANSVQTCVTSPPYYGLRDYGVDGQIGLEETPEAYVSKLVDVFREVKRVLHPTGTIWVNLGDSYVGSANSGGSGPRVDGGTPYRVEGLPLKKGDNMKPKDLMGIPWMLAFALRADGWYLRSDIIWHKPNPMPESVTDRPTKSHEYIFLLSKSREYFYDADAIKEASETGFTRDRKRQNGLRADEEKQGNHGFTSCGISESRNRRSVWTVATKPYNGAHFATFPPDLIEPCILAGTSSYGACAKCGSPWARVVETERGGPSTIDERQKAAGGNMRLAPHMPDHSRSISPTGKTPGSDTRGFPTVVSTTLGWQPTCTCGCTDVVPCLVLDPFCGSGTTLAVALKHGRRGLGLELNESYITLAHKRIASTQPMLFEVT